MTDRPKVFKAAGVWLWTCDEAHGGPLGDNFRTDDWRDPWTAALAAATKHAVLYHNADRGEDL